MTGELSAAFADPVAGSQACFRAVLDAMARPGQVHRVPAVAAPAPLCSAAGAVLLTLVDQDTPLWLDPAAGPARGWIGFHTGAPLSGDLSAAAFAMALALPDLDTLCAGTDESPETSATLVLQVTSLSAGTRWLLAGPGLRQPSALAVDGLPANFADRWAANHALFPRGIDLILCAGDRLAALPRSVSVEAG
jgi:alpha-D-ribose 1-methylphosphonate 5-triphosphate synthase subunit PhnH